MNPFGSGKNPFDSIKNVEKNIQYDSGKQRFIFRMRIFVKSMFWLILIAILLYAIYTWFISIRMFF